MESKVLSYQFFATLAEHDRPDQSIVMERLALILFEVESFLAVDHPLLDDDPHLVEEDVDYEPHYRPHIVKEDDDSLCVCGVRLCLFSDLKSVVIVIVSVHTHLEDSLEESLCSVKQLIDHLDNEALVSEEEFLEQLEDLGDSSLEVRFF